ncbi:transcriptional regulator [Cryptosporangium sp. NPDC051539]|uniref:MmyB family transcriptional regulator n=1 Tax=Cryptosporangium sp. NPDC051539 TaxID=3363962 RepID=UPI0037A67566
MPSTLGRAGPHHQIPAERGATRARPSAQVLDAVARALGLDRTATSHLHDLADPTRPEPTRPDPTRPDPTRPDPTRPGPAPRRRRAPRRAERLRPSVARLIDSWDNPAYVHGRYLDVFAANRMAVALSPILRPGTNVLRAAFLDPAAQALGAQDSLAGLVGMIRAAAGPDVDDPLLTELVGELSVRSEDFRRLWARHDVRPHPGAGAHLVRHPQVGELELHLDKFAVAGDEDQVLVVYQAEPGSRSAQALSLLATLAV